MANLNYIVKPYRDSEVRLDSADCPEFYAIINNEGWTKYYFEFTCNEKGDYKKELDIGATDNLVECAEDFLRRCF